jgi:hypothetical protein
MFINPRATTLAKSSRANKGATMLRVFAVCAALVGCTIQVPERINVKLEVTGIPEPISDRQKCLEWVRANFREPPMMTFAGICGSYTGE